MAEKKKKVFVAMSGGVDSSVAALLLKNQGFNITGVFIRCFNLDGCAERDSEDARRVAEYLKIPFYVFDFEEEYKREVVNYMVQGYREGITPNPDVMCNKKIKFGLFLKKALELGADYIATGHYVKLVVSRRVVSRNNKNTKLQTTNYKLLTARDSAKDQSYFLWTLTQEQLKYCLFPIGDYLKSEVRAIARKAGLPTAEKKDSQGICFLGKVSLADFLKDYIPENRGEILDVRGENVGTHNGAQFYTIGQRHGLNLGFRRQALGVRKNFKGLYVAEKNVKENTIVVAEGDKNSALYKKEIELRDVNFLNSYSARPIRANWRMEVLVRVRHRQPLAKAKLVKSHLSSVISHRLIFERAQKFVAPGQSAVFYSKLGELLGGGVIV